MLVPSDPLAGARGDRYGSRFWPLEGEVSSEEEGDTHHGESPVSPGDADFFQDAVRVGFTTDEIMRAEALAANASPEFVSAHGVAGHARHAKRLTTRVVDAVAELRAPCGKWHGPLPKPRISPRVSLGDVRITDQRSGGRGRARKLLAELELEVGFPGNDGGAAASDSETGTAAANRGEKGSTGDQSMHFHGPYGPRWIDMGAQRRFRCADGLGILFTAGEGPGI